MKCKIFFNVEKFYDHPLQEAAFHNSTTPTKRDYTYSIPAVLN